MWYWIVGAIVLAVCIALLTRGIWENVSPKMQRLTLWDERLPESFDGFRIAHISDFHNAKLRKKYLAALQELQDNPPDVCVITGDLIDKRRRGIFHAEALVKRLARIAPTYYVTGNHEAKSKDFSRLMQVLKDAGVCVLRNEGKALERKEQTLTFLGRDDDAFGNEEELQIPQSGYTVLLTHRPDLRGEYARLQIPLVLCGHAHGGQIRLFSRGLIAPDQGLFPKYTSGVYREGNTKTVVNRGLGNSLFPIRLNNRPEILFITLKKKEEQL